MQQVGVAIRVLQQGRQPSWPPAHKARGASGDTAMTEWTTLTIS